MSCCRDGWRGVNASQRTAFKNLIFININIHKFQIQQILVLEENVFGRLFVKRFALRYRTVVCPVCLSLCLSVTSVLWPYGWMDQDATW